MQDVSKVFALLSAVHCFIGSADGNFKRTVTYDNDLLLRCPKGIVEQLNVQTDRVSSLDVWKVALDGTVDLRLSREMYENRNLVGCKIVDNVEHFVQRAENLMDWNTDTNWFEQYHSYDSIMQWYEQLAIDNPGLVRIRTAGMSVEQRVQPAIHISGDAVLPPRFKIFLLCQIRAREWISVSVCMYVSNFLVKNYFDADVRGLMNSLEFILIPFVNPDGYQYSWTVDRLWTKNRHRGVDCIGVDLNRNFPIHWGEKGSSDYECSEFYRGTSAGSEPETTNMINYFRENGPILGAIEWDSNHQRILRPWGWTSQDSPNEPFLKELGDMMSAVTSSVHGINYTSEKASDAFNASGTARDWLYSTNASRTNSGYKAAAYTVELRKDGDYGFFLPPDQIVPTGQEMAQMVLEFSRYVLSNPIPTQNG